MVLPTRRIHEIFGAPRAVLWKRQLMKDDSHLGDFIEDQKATSPAEHAASEILKTIEDTTDTLTDIERKCLFCAYVLVCR